MQEIWKDIPNYEGLYQVSNIGNVKILNANGDKILKKSISSGYYCVGLKGKFYYVHKLVAFTFIPNPNNLPLINHKDGNKQNNNINNLEWCTYSHNTKEAYRLGLIKKNKMMKVIPVRLPDNIINWLNEMAKGEGVAISTMLRLFLDRKMQEQNIDKQCEERKEENKMKEFKVNVDNVKECWEYYEAYMEEYRKTHYSDDTNYNEFVDWCENELYECPCCGNIVLKDGQERLHDPYNSDNVCDDCIENGGYYE